MPRRSTKWSDKLEADFPFIINKEYKGDIESGVFCTVCNSSFSIANGGRADINNHLKTAKHKACDVVTISSDSKLDLDKDSPISPGSEGEAETTSEPELSHLKKLKRRLTHSKPAGLVVEKVNQLEEALSIFRAEVDLKLKIMQQIFTTRNEQVSIQKKLLEREQSLYDTLLGHWMNAPELASTGQSVNLAEPAADNSDVSAGDEEYQYQSDPDYSPPEHDEFGQPPVQKKSKSSLRRKRKSGRSYSEQNEAFSHDVEIVKYSDSEHNAANAGESFTVPDHNNCTWEEENPTEWEPNVGVGVMDKSGNEADFGENDYHPPMTANEKGHGQSEHELPKRMKREDSHSTLKTYEEYSDGKHCTDKLWQWFLRERGGQSAKCKLCQKVLKCPKSSPTGLRSHIKRVHQIDLD